MKFFKKILINLITKILKNLRMKKVLFKMLKNSYLNLIKQQIEKEKKQQHTILYITSIE